MSTEPLLTPTPSQCVISDHWHGAAVTIHCDGVLDMLTSPALQHQIDSALQKRPAAVIVDLSSVDFLASSGMSVLIAAHDRCSPTIQFTVVADGPATSRPMQLIGLTDIITVYPTLDQALEALAA